MSTKTRELEVTMVLQESLNWIVIVLISIRFIKTYNLFNDNILTIDNSTFIFVYIIVKFSIEIYKLVSPQEKSSRSLKF